LVSPLVPSKKSEHDNVGELLVKKLEKQSLQK